MKALLEVRKIEKRVPVSGRIFQKIALPYAVKTALDHGANLIVSTSGGKDSDCMLRCLKMLHDHFGWTGKIVAMFADLGRIEWAGTHEHIHALCDELGVELVVVRREKGGMIERWNQRFEKIVSESNNDKPFWSSSQARYCQSNLKVTPLDTGIRQQDEKLGDKAWASSSTNRYCQSDLKRSPCDTGIRKQGNLAVCAIGIRSEESTNRAKDPYCEVRPSVTAKWLQKPEGETEEEKWAEFALEQWLACNEGDRGRLVINWHPLKSFTVDDVWEVLGTSSKDVARRRELFAVGLFKEALEGFEPMWTYITGASRHSCSMCVMARVVDLQAGASHNPLEWLELALLEIISGWSFKKDLWLAALKDFVLQFKPDYYRKLYSVLYDLNVVKRWSASYSLQFMATMPVELLGCLTYEFVESVAGAIEAVEGTATTAVKAPATKAKRKRTEVVANAA